MVEEMGKDTFNDNFVNLNDLFDDLMFNRMVGETQEEMTNTAKMTATTEEAPVMCSGNCSGHGVCLDGFCHCQIQYEGFECKTINFAYHVAFASIFFLLAMTSLLQLIMCIHAEYLRMKHPSITKACRVTTQKLLYFLVFLAASLRGVYFAAPTLSSQWALSLMSAFYPVLLTGASLIVCFWAEVFHLREVCWDRPRFLSKSFLGFLIFNVITYTLLATELFLVYIEYEDREFYSHIFNGCYAGLMFIVVIFFLIYGVEVFFKVRGGFTVSHVPGMISNRSPLHRQSSSPLLAREIELKTINEEVKCSSNPKDGFLTKKQVRRNSEPLSLSQHPNQIINTSQLHQSRLGLLSQALMMIITVGFLLSETLDKFWKTKVDLVSRNTHDVVFRTVEIGVALWFPCVLWNCIRPEQLWCLNPKKILMRLPPMNSNLNKSSNDGDTNHLDSDSEEEDDMSPECWICYDPERNDAGPMIHPCNCKGDVGAVHHDCLRRWLVESADNPDALKCKVCNGNYVVEKGSQFSLAQGFTFKQWLLTVTTVTIMLASLGGCWAVNQIYSQAWVRMLAVGCALLIQYICLRSLGLNTVNAYQRAKVSALKIVNLNKKRMSRSRKSHVSVITAPSLPHDMNSWRGMEGSESKI